MSIQKTLVSFKPEKPVETPYLKARQEWDERLGQTVVQAKNWRVAFFCLSTITVLLVASNLFQLSQSKLIPWVVTVDRNSGETNIFGKVAVSNYEPRDEEIKYFLSVFLQNVRAVPADPVIIKENWTKSYEFLRKEAANMLNNLTNKDEDSPLKKIGDKTVTIKPISIVKVGGGASYQVRWEEAVFNKNGGLEDQYTMTGVFTIEISAPTNEETLSINPLGIYITNFQWNKELT